MKHTPVLIVGSGPTGLNLALRLARRGVPHKLITEGAGPGERSRAMVVQARTLEFYAQYGFADEMVDQGVIAGGAHLRKGGANGTGCEVASFSFKEMGEGLSPYPFALAYPQDDHERFLVGKLNAAGGAVEWRSRLVGFTTAADKVRATILCDGQMEDIEAAYICGCDGARSRVRETLGIGFPGGTYEQLFFVADVRINRGFERDLYINLGEHILTLMFPVRSSGMQRLIGLVPPELSERQDLVFEDIRSQVEKLLDIRVTEINWFSTYRVHHRVADRFHVGRAFLLGDAGHIHSPAGGQGMNTGIGDAVNLGWKLAEVIQGRADASLLDSYEPERIGFARSLVSTTDRAFTPMVAEGWKGELTRRFLAPLFITAVTRFTLSRHAIFRVVSQTRIHYADSPLSEGRAGEVHGGDRLPWVRNGAADNFAPLRSLDWQLHVYGEMKEGQATVCRGLGIPAHVFPWSDDADRAGFIRQRVYRNVIDTPKTDQSLRKAALSKGLLREIEQWRAVAVDTRAEAWVFPSERLTPLSKDNCWRRSMIPKLKTAGLAWANFLVMRRTHATLMKALGVDGKLVADQLGHSLDVNQNVYTQSPVESRLDMVNQLEESLLVN